MGQVRLWLGYKGKWGDAHRWTWNVSWGQGQTDQRLRWFFPPFGVCVVVCRVLQFGFPFFLLCQFEFMYPHVNHVLKSPQVHPWTLNYIEGNLFCPISNSITITGQITTALNQFCLFQTICLFQMEHVALPSILTQWGRGLLGSIKNSSSFILLWFGFCN